MDKVSLRIRKFFSFGSDNEEMDPNSLERDLGGYGWKEVVLVQAVGGWRRLRDYDFWIWGWRVGIGSWVVE